MELIEVVLRGHDDHDVGIDLRDRPEESLGCGRRDARASVDQVLERHHAWSQWLGRATDGLREDFRLNVDFQ